jgi:hypothetical protein
LKLSNKVPRAVLQQYPERVDKMGSERPTITENKAKNI